MRAMSDKDDWDKVINDGANAVMFGIAISFSIVLIVFLLITAGQKHTVYKMPRKCGIVYNVPGVEDGATHCWTPTPQEDDAP